MYHRSSIWNTLNILIRSLRTQCRKVFCLFCFLVVGPNCMWIFFLLEWGVSKYICYGTKSDSPGAQTEALFFSLDYLETTSSSFPSSSWLTSWIQHMLSNISEWWWEQSAIYDNCRAEHLGRERLTFSKTAPPVTDHKERKRMVIPLSNKLPGDSPSQQQ